MQEFGKMFRPFQLIVHCSDIDWWTKSPSAMCLAVCRREVYFPSNVHSKLVLWQQDSVFISLRKIWSHHLPGRMADVKPNIGNDTKPTIEGSPQINLNTSKSSSAIFLASQVSPLRCWHGISMFSVPREQVRDQEGKYECVPCSFEARGCSSGVVAAFEMTCTWLTLSELLLPALCLLYETIMDYSSGAFARGLRPG